jgi:arylsulfatase/uncharacterized sulfatase
LPFPLLACSQRHTQFYRGTFPPSIVFTRSPDFNHGLLGDTKWRLYDLSTDPGETKDVSAANQKLFASMLAEYRSYSEKVGVIEVGPEDSAFKELFKNVVKKALHKYWPYALGMIVAFAAALYLTFRIVRGFVRPAAAKS